MQSFAQRLKRPSFLNKLFFSLIALVLTVTLLLTGILLTSYYSSANDLVSRFFFNLLRQSNYSITYTNGLSQQLSASLSYDADVVAFLNLRTQDNVQTVKTHQAVRKVVLPLSYVDSIYLYNSTLDLLLDTKTGIQSRLENFYDQGTAQQLKRIGDNPTNSYVPFVHYVTYFNSTSQLYSYIIPNYNKSGVLTSAMVVNLNVDILTQTLQELSANNANLKFVVFSPEGVSLLDAPFTSDAEQADMEELITQILSSGSGETSFTYHIGQTKYVVAYSNANANGWYLCGLIPYHVVFQNVIVTTVLSVLFILLLLGISCYVALLLAKRLNRPVEVISQMVSGDAPPEEVPEMLQTTEFRSIASAVVQMQKQNQEYSSYHDKTAKIVRKNFLDGLFSGSTFYSQAQVAQNLTAMGCEYMLTAPCIMCLFAIDDYAAFAQNTNPRERNALRFAVVNLATELLREHFACEMISHGPSKFVAVLGCPEQGTPGELRASLEEALGQFLEVVKTHLEFTLTVAYSSSFRGIEHMPRMYENLEELLLLRVRHGHGRILSPSMAEDLTLGEFQVSSTAENILVSSVVNGSAEQAMAQFQSIAGDLFQYSYNEIMPYLTHLAYRLLISAKETNCSAGQSIAEAFKVVSARLPQCEIEADFRSCFSAYLERICSILSAQKANQETQSSKALVSRVIQIIESDYTNPEICLGSIADNLGLSTHYIGQIFRSSQGKSVSQYILDLRLEKIAQAMRESSRPFADIMEEVGFEAKQKNYIYTCFKKHFGVTVKNYRMQYSDTKS